MTDLSSSLVNPPHSAGLPPPASARSSSSSSASAPVSALSPSVSKSRHQSSSNTNGNSNNYPPSPPPRSASPDHGHAHNSTSSRWETQQRQRSQQQQQQQQQQQKQRQQEQEQEQEEQTNHNTYNDDDEEDEPYTIKCICDYDDDDGSTVFCEGCETWQHIICYYEEHDVPDIHNCVDCEPRYFDSQAATERQKRLRESNVDDAGSMPSPSGAASAGAPSPVRERRSSNTKRSASAVPTKTSQKRPLHKDPDTGSNGAGAGNAVTNARSRARSNSTSNVRDQPVKKGKTSHRPSASVPNASSSLASHPTNINSDVNTTERRRSSSSPSKSIPFYSNEFLHLYDHCPTDAPNGEANLFLTIGLTKDLMNWAQDPSTIPSDGNGRLAKDSFTRSTDPMDYSGWPKITTRTKINDSVEIDNCHPLWKYLSVDTPVRRDNIVGEVRGRVGYLRDYSLDPTARWQSLRHPAPFVFFHPQLPIYIDSREEGTQLRYIRRSCRPNVTMRTFITNMSEYHFCFVATRDISADEEITASWYLDPQLFGLAEPDDSTPEAAAVCFSNVLSIFGGCACESPTCLIAKLDRRKPLKDAEKAGPGQSKKSRTRARGSISVQKNGDSRAKQQDDDDNLDRRSVSGSAYSRSRDLTPVMSPVDMLGPGISAREKRKLEALEKKFKELEHHQQPQDSQQPSKRRRKSRTANEVGTSTRSSSPTAITTAAPAPKKPPRGAKLQSLDISKTRHISAASSARASPRSATTNRQGRTSGASDLPAVTTAASSPAARQRTPKYNPKYTDAGIQTDYVVPMDADPISAGREGSTGAPTPTVGMDLDRSPSSPVSPRGAHDATTPSSFSSASAAALPFRSPVSPHIRHLRRMIRTLRKDKQRFHELQQGRQDGNKEGDDRDRNDDRGKTNGEALDRQDARRNVPEDARNVKSNGDNTAISPSLRPPSPPPSSLHLSRSVDATTVLPLKASMTNTLSPLEKMTNQRPLSSGIREHIEKG